MNYDAIIVGGGLAGSVIGKQLAENGKKVLILEREKKFKDRVRGENLLPWGVLCARRLGVVKDLLAAGGTQPQFSQYILAAEREKRETSKQPLLLAKLKSTFIIRICRKRCSKARSMPVRM
jgi:2-polyprenyl-6-methoxyphenol hydroxylase-like FAD-dependent oxidoreductase